MIFLSKIHWPTTVTEFCIPPIESFDWIIVGNGYISCNGSYKYSYWNTLYEILHSIFPISLTGLNSKWRAKLILSFSLRECVIPYLNISAEFFSQKETYDNYRNRNTQDTLVSCKLYNLGAPGNGFIITSTLLRPEGTSKRRSSDTSNNML